MENLSQVLKALSDETRLKMIELLLQNDFCVGALSRKLNISEAAVSQHLKVLRNAGIVAGDKRGYYTHYDVCRDLIEEVSQSIHAIAAYSGDRKGCRQHITGNHEACPNKR
jgi:DNA-binding transcriptional ArsR family regulator